MLSVVPGRRIWLCTQPTDMRCSFDGLSARVKQHLDEDPLLCVEQRYVAPLNELTALPSNQADCRHIIVRAPLFASLGIVPGSCNRRE